ncbi:MAG: hypothetical protein AAF957_17770 [Planctomycetota bacterium]
MASIALAAAAASAAAQGEGSLLPGGAEGLFLGMIVMTTIAGWLDVVQQFRSESAFPVPLVVYTTMFPVISFIVLLMFVKEEQAPLAHYAAVLSPLPLIVIPRVRAFLRAEREQDGPGGDPA